MAIDVVSVNVGRPRLVQFGDRFVRTSIWKQPVDHRVAVRGVNIDGDNQSDRSAHGGPDKALYAYAREDLDYWATRLDRNVPAGFVGENLTVRGLDVSAAVVGERWLVGTALLEVSAPRIPCYKLGIRAGDPAFPRVFGLAQRPGAYLRIVENGEVGAGDQITVVEKPDHGVTVALVAAAYHLDRSLLPQLLTAPQLSPSWMDWARELLTTSDRCS